MHPLQAHIYIPAHEEANWIRTSLPTLKQPSSKESTFLMLVLFLFTWGPYAAIFFPKVFKYCLPSVGLSHPSSSPLLADLYLNMLGKVSVA